MVQARLLVRLGLVGASVLAVAGCAPRYLNERLAIGVAPTASFAGSDRGGRPLSMRDSVARPRDVWDTLVDGAPIDGIVHDPVMRSRRPVSRDDEAYRVGAYPDPLGVGYRGPSDSLFRSIGDLGRASIDAGVLAVRSVNLGIRRDHSALQMSPRTIWKRTPTTRARIGTIPAAMGDTGQPRMIGTPNHTQE